MRLLPALAALCLTACGSGVPEATAPAPTTAPAPAPTVSGTVYVAPKCPISAPPRPCPSQPAPAADVEIRDGTTRDPGPVVATTRTGADGRYTVTVAPGRYAVTARVAGPPATDCGTLSVTVPPPATADLTCTPIGAP